MASNQLTKRELIEQLKIVVCTDEHHSEAFFDIQINRDDPKKSRIVANRPGLEAFATDLLSESEDFFSDVYSMESYLDSTVLLAKESKKRSKIAFSEIEFVEIMKFQDALVDSQNRKEKEGFRTSLWFYFRLIVYVFALFGAFAVCQFFTS